MIWRVDLARKLHMENQASRHAILAALFTSGLFKVAGVHQIVKAVQIIGQGMQSGQAQCLQPMGSTV